MEVAENFDYAMNLMKPVLARKGYLETNDEPLIYIDWYICKHYEMEVTDKWYDHKPNTVTEGRDVTILWDMLIHRDKEIKANRPYIIVKGKSKSNAPLLIWLCYKKETLQQKRLRSFQNTKILKLKLAKCGTKNHCHPTGNWSIRNNT